MTAKTDFHAAPADPERLGVRCEKDGYVFAVAVPEDETAELLLYRRDEEEPCRVIELPAEERIGEVSCVSVRIPDGGKYEYNYRINNRIVPDPYARVVRLVDAKNSSTGNGKQIRCALTKAEQSHSDPLEIPYEDCFFYKAHVRGLTMGKGAGVKHPGTFTGVKEKIPYLKDLGVNALILMPVYEFTEETDPGRVYVLDSSIRVLEPKKQEQTVRKNYWGYAGGLYFAPKESYSLKDPGREFAAMVDALHAAGIECILEFYFDSRVSGAFAAEVLRYWRIQFHVDGFRLIGGGNWSHAVQADPVLKRSKLLFTGFDYHEVYADGKAPKKKYLGEINLGYEYLMRRFLKGDTDVHPSEAAQFMRRTSPYAGIINYFADQDGFTMADMVSYEERHNEQNGEGNRDGAQQNFTWNCGEEGSSRKNAVKALRAQQLRNAVLMLMTSQGSPMLLAGDEVLNSQQGNNNAWCQDNETGWVTWNRAKAARAQLDLIKKAVKFRKKHPVLHTGKNFRMSDYRTLGLPDLSYHTSIAWVETGSEMRNGIGALYNGQYVASQNNETDDMLYIAYNMYWKEQSFALPHLPEGKKWYVKADTTVETVFVEDGAEPLIRENGKKGVQVAPRSIMILIAK
ncbi:MAG: alpha-amylase family glycosyl hydrolase [Eubacterium sp.]|nr:alpha-amylase family glycosyl hydrolase [Eubacterium sp.]